MCEYRTQTDSIIRDHIVVCCISTKLKRKLLETPNILLGDTLKLARSLEAAEIHATAIEKHETSETFNPENSLDKLSNLRQNRKSNRRKTQPDWLGGAHEQVRLHNQPSTSAATTVMTCYRCGEPGHRLCDKARGKTCSRCGKVNHFAKASRSPANNPTSPREVNRLSQAENAADTTT